ncbi:response regulator [bacterium]|nr:response regulator [bacterium]
MNSKILFVDDDPNILSGFRRTLHKHYSVDTAESGKQGLVCLETQGPYAVIVSDMRMPEMNGAQFLAQVKQHFPDSVRILLTGQSDMTDAIAAINEGSIFRFLTKPCEMTLLSSTLDDALKQYHLITAERELLEKTLNGSIKLLTDMLSLANHAAVSRAERIKKIIAHMAHQAAIPNAWQYELAAMLSQIGAVTLPLEILQKYNQGDPLSTDESSMLDTVPLITRDLLINIPRLENTARMIFQQREPFEKFQDKALDQRDPVELGSQLLNIAITFDHFIIRKAQPASQIILHLTEQRKLYDPLLVATLKSLQLEIKTLSRQTLDIYEITPGMIIASNIKTYKGVFLVPEGQEINPTIIKFLQNYMNRNEIDETIEVLVPCGTAKSPPGKR